MNLTGTKLACPTCHAQAVVTRGGAGELRCHGEPMTVLAGSSEKRTTTGPAVAGEHHDPFYD